VLVLTRRAGESIVIGDDVRVVVLDVRGDTVRLGIEAPRSIQVHRAEVYAEVQAANAAAAASGESLEEVAERLRRLSRPVVPRPAAPQRPGGGDQRERRSEQRPRPAAPKPGPPPRPTPRPGPAPTPPATPPEQSPPAGEATRTEPTGQVRTVDVDRVAPKPGPVSPIPRPGEPVEQD